ncbi:plancitoxin-1-like [Tubulanus polymorphus]|uniref:plancitoxin-1-like n=1 Tax=Tubulanus polymorphus TaxID=672921 RepID=UPI003DA52E2B
MRLLTIVAGICVLFFYLVFVHGLKTKNVTCRDRNNDTVDWFIVYKMPINSVSKSSAKDDGYDFYYMDSVSNQFRLSETLINRLQQPVGYTLQQIYLNSNDIHWMMYNDQKKSKLDGNDEHAHQKGVVAYDSETGFLLVHSVPNFPNTKTYSYPATAAINGQIMLCISMNHSQFASIEKMLNVTKAGIYGINVPPKYPFLFPNALNRAKKINDEFCCDETVLTSIDGQSFCAFSKGSDVVADLYEDIVAPKLQSNLNVETWRIGAGGKLESSKCDKDYKVFNVISIKIGNHQFRYSKDHSKWAVTPTKTSKGGYVCIGDLNRMESQKYRGGGTVCFAATNQKVWETFIGIINEVEPCVPVKYCEL